MTAKDVLLVAAKIVEQSRTMEVDAAIKAALALEATAVAQTIKQAGRGRLFADLIEGQWRFREGGSPSMSQADIVTLLREIAERA